MIAMERTRRQQRVTTLWGLIALGAIYGGLLIWLHTLTGWRVIDGSIGVVLGLYICSHPAANAIDVLFFERGAVRRLWSGWSGRGWLVLNLLALTIGLLVIAMGATRFAVPATRDLNHRRISFWVSTRSGDCGDAKSTDDASMPGRYSGRVVGRPPQAHGGQGRATETRMQVHGSGGAAIPESPAHGGFCAS